MKWCRATNRMPMTAGDSLMLDQLDGVLPGVRSFLASNGRARERLAGRLIKATRAVRAAEFGMDWLHITILLESWTTGDQRPNIDLERITREGTAIIDQMASHWSAAVELQAFANRTHSQGGKLLSPHVHAVAWGYDIANSATAIAEEYNPLMIVSSPGITALKVQRIRSTAVDLARVVRYPLMAPDRRKTLYFNPRTERYNLHESEANDRFIAFLRMFEVLSGLRQRDLLFAGGDGVSMQDKALSAVSRRLRSESNYSSEAVAMPDISAFWLDFMPRNAWARFDTPNIIRPQPLDPRCS